MSEVDTYDVEFAQMVRAMQVGSDELLDATLDDLNTYKDERIVAASFDAGVELFVDVLLSDNEIDLKTSINFIQNLLDEYRLDETTWPEIFARCKQRKEIKAKTDD